MRVSTSICRAGHVIRNQRLTGMPHALNPFVGVPNPDYTGWYVEGSWFFGGHKTYEDEGTWGRPKIDNPMRGTNIVAGAPCSLSRNTTSST